MEEIMKELLANVRGENLGSTYSGGRWDKPESHSCQLCNAKWKPGEPEAHDPECLIARADKMLGQEPPVMRLRPL